MFILDNAAYEHMIYHVPIFFFSHANHMNNRQFAIVRSRIMYHYVFCHTSLALNKNEYTTLHVGALCDTPYLVQKKVCKNFITFYHVIYFEYFRRADN